MTSGQRVLIAAFALVVAAGAVLLARELSPPPARPMPKEPAHPAPPRRSPSPSSGDGGSETRRKPRGPGTVVVTRPDGRSSEGGVTAWGFAHEPGTLWVRIPETGPDGMRRVTLPTAGPPIALTVSEADGSPAADVLLSYAPLFDEVPVRRTDASGRFTIDDAPRGVLRVRVGGAERAGPLLTLVVGRDTAAAAVLDPPWTISGRVLDEQGAPTEACMRAQFPGRLPGASLCTSDGRFRYRTKIEERIALRWRTRGDAPIDVEPPLPDPRGPLVSDVEVRALPTTSLSIEGVEDVTRVLAEPAVLAVAREVFGPADSLLDAGPSLGPRRLVPANRVPLGVSLRVSVRGNDLVPEDHVLTPAADGSTRLRLSPQPTVPEPEAPPDKDPAATGSLIGKVVDGAGAPLSGVTVDAVDGRATTGADGTFRIEGLIPGRSLDLVWAWLDGADPGPAQPKDFEPYGTARYSPSATPVTLVLRKAAAVTMRLVDGLDDHPLSWAHVLLSDGEGGVAFDGAVATREGNVRLEGLPVGPAGILVVLAPGYRREVRLTLRAGETTDVGALRLSHGAKATGLVRDARGAPIAGARVALLPETSIQADAGARLRDREALLRRATTDAKGEASIDGLDPSRAAGFAVWAEGFAPTTARANPGAPGEPMRFEATLRKGGSVVLRVMDPANAPVSGALIDVRSALSGARRLDLIHRAALGTVVGSSEDVRIASALLLTEDPKKPGRYVVGPVEPGPYDLEVTRPGYRPYRSRFTVPDDGEDVPANAPAEPGMMRVSTKSFGSIEWPVRLEPAAPGGRGG